MDITYDSNKNQLNIECRQLSFDQVADLDWETAWVYEDERNDYDEIRYVAYAMYDQRLHIVCFTETDEGIRVISFRKANSREVKRYEQRAFD